MSIERLNMIAQNNELDVTQNTNFNFQYVKYLHTTMAKFSLPYSDFRMCDIP